MVAIAVIAVATTMTGGDEDGPASAGTPPDSAPRPGVSQAPTQASIEPDALATFLLSAEEISERMDSPGMTAEPVARDPANTIANPANCSGVWTPADNAAYVGSGFTGLAGQVVREQPTPNHQVFQAVVSFPDAAAARAFYDTQVAAWNACKFQKVTAQFGTSTETATVGVPATIDDITFVLLNPATSGRPLNCQRAIGVRTNVVIDVRACSPMVGSAGMTLVRDISRKIPGNP